MTRYFKPVGKDFLESKIMDLVVDFDDCYYHGMPITQSVYEIKYYWPDLSNQLVVDLGEIIFDFENCHSRFDDEHYPECGFHTLDNGFTYLGVVAGGDWEYPVFFCVYWDGEQVRAYIPMVGNPYNTDTNHAYGNDDDSDAENSMKRFGTTDYMSVDRDMDAILRDIRANIILAETVE